VNLYEQQMKKINSLVNSLHDDLRADYKRDIDRLSKI
jgi:ribosomal protein S13